MDENQQINALVFGATGAIGREVSFSLASKVDHLTLTSRKLDLQNFLIDEIKKKNPKAAMKSFVLDFEQYKNEAFENLPGLNTIVFCSGAHTGLKYIDQLTDEEINASFHVNLLGLIKAARDVLPKVKEGGKIIFLNSMSNKQLAKRNSALYETQKFALHRFIQAFRNEAVLKKIQVIEINLGLFESALTYQAYGGEEQFKKKFAKMKLLKPQEIAATIQWVLDQNNNTFITELNLTTVDQCYQLAMMN